MKHLWTIFFVLVLAASSRADCDLEGCDECVSPEPSAGQQCSKCATGFLLQSGACQHCPRGCSVCTPGTTAADEFVCTTCGGGFYLQGSECGECSTFCETCKGPTETDCITCITGSDYNADTKLCDPFSKSAFIWIFAAVGFVIAILTVALVWNCIKKAKEDKLRPPPIDQFAGLNEENRIQTKKKKKPAANYKNKVAPKKGPTLDWRVPRNQESSSMPVGGADVPASPYQDRLRSSVVTQSGQTQFKFASDSDNKLYAGNTSTTPTAVSENPRSLGI